MKMPSRKNFVFVITNQFRLISAHQCSHDDNDDALNYNGITEQENLLKTYFILNLINL